MSATIAAPREPLLQLPGFMPDAVPFAVRTTAALLLAYIIAFAMQLDTASSAGLCVAIVAQPSPGMALSKAVWRTLGTIVGGVVSLVFLACFPQDRTMLLACFTLFLGACTFVAALLRDFRSYGAVLCGYTVGIIAIGAIDAPQSGLLAMLNRVAAILLGIACVALVNAVMARSAAFEGLVAALDERFRAADALAGRAMAGEALPDDVVLAETGGAILALRTDAGYAAVELPDARHGTDAAIAAIAGLLGMISTSRGLGEALRTRPDAIRLLTAPDAPALTAADVFVRERAGELRRQRDLARDSLAALRDGRRPSQTVRLSLHSDVVGAALSAVRTVVAVSLGCVFCVYAGWPGATLLLIQQAAFTALLGMQPNPSAAGVRMGISLVPAALAAGVVAFLLLPLASGFVPFALALGPFVFAACLATRHPRTAAYGPGMLLYLTLLLAPSNVEVFDAGAFANGVLVQVLAVLFMILAFRFVLPVSRERRLTRVAAAVADGVRRAASRDGPLEDVASARARRFDRLAQAQVWLGARTPARLAVSRRLCRFSELEAALLRARHGLRGRGEPFPAVDAAALRAAADRLAVEGASDLDTMRAVSGLHEAAWLVESNGRALVRYRARMA